VPSSTFNKLGNLPSRNNGDSSPQRIEPLLSIILRIDAQNCFLSNPSSTQFRAEEKIEGNDDGTDVFMDGN